MVLYSRRQPGDDSDERKSLSSSCPLHPGHQSQSHFARHYSATDYHHRKSSKVPATRLGLHAAQRCIALFRVTVAPAVRDVPQGVAVSFTLIEEIYMCEVANRCEELRTMSGNELPETAQNVTKRLKLHASIHPGSSRRAWLGARPQHHQPLLSSRTPRLRTAAGYIATEPRLVHTVSVARSRE